MNVYKLKNGKTEGSFQLPIKNEMIAVPDKEGNVRLKKIIYIPGADTIIAEEYKGDQKSKSIWFEDGEVRADEKNWALNEIMQKHSWFNKNYVLVNEEKTAQEEVDNFTKITEVSNTIIQESDDFKLKAMAMVVISEDAVNWGPSKAKNELLKYAKNHSNLLLAEMNKQSYEGRFLAALSFNKGIVKHNAFRTAVVWNDDHEKIIVKVLEGENGLDKFGEFLASQTEKSTAVLQRIGEKVEALDNTPQTKSFIPETSAPAKTVEQIRQELYDEVKAQALADAKAELEKENKGKDLGTSSDDSKVVKTDDGAGKSDLGYDPADKDQAHAKYKELFEKDVANLKKNDLEWINAQIATKLT